MLRIVSLTPLKVAADSRTYKIAASFGRFGYDSIVVEGYRSELKKSELPFALIHVPSTEAAVRADVAPSGAVAAPSPAQSCNRAAALIETAAALPTLPAEPEPVAPSSPAYLAAVAVPAPQSPSDVLATAVTAPESVLASAPPDPWPLERSLGRLPAGLRHRLRPLIPVFLPAIRLADRFVTWLRAFRARCKRAWAAQVAAYERAWAAKDAVYDLLRATASSLPEVASQVGSRVRSRSIELVQAAWASLRLFGLRVGLRVAACVRIGLLEMRRGVLHVMNAMGWTALKTKILFIRAHLIKYGVQPFRVLPPADLYYLHAPYQYPAVWLACLRYRARFIYDAHDFYPIVDPHPFYAFLERQCVRKALAVVTVSEGVARLHAEAFGSRPVVIRNSHDLRMDRTPPRSLREVLGLRDGDFLLVSIGHGGKEGQATTQAVESLLELPAHVHLAFVGNHHEDSQQAIDRLGLQRRAHVVPAVPLTEVVPFVRSADCALVLYTPVNPDYEHALPNKFFQSIAAELPILYSPGLPEINEIALRHDLGVPIDPGAPASISEGVRRMMDPEQLARARRGTAAARAVITWAAEERMLGDLIDRVTGARIRRVRPRRPAAVAATSIARTALTEDSEPSGLVHSDRATGGWRRRA
jgi:glycosyltransferase involved in cell wall biosynthesis